MLQSDDELRLKHSSIGEPRSSYKILGVDDEPDIAALISKAFHRYGFSFDIFSDPEKALGAFAASPHSYVLVVTDLRMPGMNGVELATRIKKIKPDVKILFMTAYLAEEIHNSTYGSIYKRDVIEKPFSLEIFCQEIRKRLVIPSSQS